MPGDRRFLRAASKAARRGFKRRSLDGRFQQFQLQGGSGALVEQFQ